MRRLMEVKNKDTPFIFGLPFEFVFTPTSSHSITLLQWPLENFYGIVKFNLIENRKDLIPLGGIKLINLNKAKLIKSEGIAIMSEVKKKPAISSRLF